MVPSTRTPIRDRYRVDTLGEKKSTIKTSAKKTPSTTKMHTPSTPTPSTPTPDTSLKKQPSPINIHTPSTPSTSFLKLYERVEEIARGVDLLLKYANEGTPAPLLKKEDPNYMVYVTRFAKIRMNGGNLIMR